MELDPTLKRESVGKHDLSMPANFKQFQQRDCMKALEKRLHKAPHFCWDLHEMSKSAQKVMFANPCSKVVELMRWGYIPKKKVSELKDIPRSAQSNVFNIHHHGSGVWGISFVLLGITWNLQICIEVMFGIFTSWGCEDGFNFQKKIVCFFARNSMKCPDLHRKVMFPTLIPME